MNTEKLIALIKEYDFHTGTKTEFAKKYNISTRTVTNYINKYKESERSPTQHSFLKNRDKKGRFTFSTEQLNESYQKTDVRKEMDNAYGLWNIS